MGPEYSLDGVGGGRRKRLVRGRLFGIGGPWLVG